MKIRFRSGNGLKGSGSIFFLIISVILVHGCQPKAEELMTKANVSYIDSLLAQRPVKMIQAKETEKEFQPWSIYRQHLKLEIGTSEKKIISGQSTMMLVGESFRQDNIRIQIDSLNIDSLMVTTTERNSSSAENLLSDDVGLERIEGGAMSIDLNRFVARGDTVLCSVWFSWNGLSPVDTLFTKRLPYNLHDSGKMMWTSTGDFLSIFPLLSGSDDAFWLDAEVVTPATYRAFMHIPMIQETESGGLRRSFFSSSKPTSIHKWRLFTLPLTNLYKLGTTPTVLIDAPVSGDPSAVKATFESIQEHALAERAERIVISENPPFTGSGSDIMLPNNVLLDSTVMPSLSNDILFRKAALTNGYLNDVTPVNDQIRQFLSDRAEAKALNGLESVERAERLQQMKQSLHNELARYARPIWNPNIDSVFVNRDAHYQVKGVLIQRYLNWMLGEEVSKAFSDAIRENTTLDERQLIELLSQVNGRSMQNWIRHWYREPGFPIIEAEQFIGKQGKLSLHLRQKSVAPGWPVYSLTIPVILTDEQFVPLREKTVTLSSRDSIYTFNSAAEYVLIDPQQIVPAIWTEKLTDEQIAGRVLNSSREPSIGLRTLYQHRYPSGSNAVGQVDSLMHSNISLKLKHILMQTRLDVAGATPEMYADTTNWQPRSLVHLLTFARTDTARNAMDFILRSMDHPNLFVQSEARITAVIRGLAKPENIIVKWAGQNSYRDVKRKTSVFITSMLSSVRRNEWLSEIWQDTFASNKTRMMIVGYWEDSGTQEIQELEKMLYNSLTAPSFRSDIIRLRLAEILISKGSKDMRSRVKYYLKTTDKTDVLRLLKEPDDKTGRKSKIE